MLKLGVPTVSSFCKWDEDQCVEITRTETSVLVRDTKLGIESPILSFSHEEWDAFIAGVQAREFATA